MKSFYKKLIAKITQPIFPRNKWWGLAMVMAVAAAGIFLLAKPAGASVASVIAEDILMPIAGLLGKLLIVIIDILLGIVSYNGFTDAAAVTKGWVIVRDVCNMFFVLVLLLIAFGTILKIESYKYNRLLGKLILMVVLINFSKLIAGFFIDLAQVVMMTFVNAFVDIAHNNFADMFKLQDMLNFANGVTAPGTLDLISVPLLAIFMLIIAIMTMIAMVVVFLVRIIALWLLVVLSPLAYLLNVLPMGQRYSSQWWSTFGKWLTTGPILAFFIWLSLTVLNNTTATQMGLQSKDSAGVSAAISTVASSENILSFILSIAMLMIALVVAQSLGGIAGSFAGKMATRAKDVGAKPFKWAGTVAGAPIKGVSELAKSAGRGIRRNVRDRLPAWVNVPSLIKGAKQRGEMLETQSKDLAAARGRETWEKAKGVEGIPHESLARARIIRQKANEYAALQKEQKAGMAEKLYGRKGLQSELERQALTVAQGMAAHLDDATVLPRFADEMQWKEAVYKRRENGEIDTDKRGKPVLDHYEDRTGFKEQDELVDKGGEKYEVEYVHNSKIAWQYAKAMMSKGDFRTDDVNKIDPAAADALYDIEEAANKNGHSIDLGGMGEYNAKAKEMEAVADFKRKSEIAVTNYRKKTSRAQMAEQLHTYSEFARNEITGEVMPIVPRVNMPENEGLSSKQAYSIAVPKGAGEFGDQRIPMLVGNFKSDTKQFEIRPGKVAEESLRKLYEDNYDLLKVAESKKGAQGYRMKRYKRDEKGNILKDQGGKAIEEKDANNHPIIDEWKTIDEFVTDYNSHIKDEKRKWSTTGSDNWYARQQKTGEKKEGKEKPVKTTKEKKQAHQEEATIAQQQSIEKRRAAAKLATEADEMEASRSSDRQAIDSKRQVSAKLMEEADMYERGVKLADTEVSIDNFVDGATKLKPEELKNIQSSLPEDSTKKLIEQLDTTLSELSRSTTAAFSDFGKEFEENIKVLTEALDKFPDEVKKDLPEKLDGLQKSADDATTKAEQYKHEKLLRRIAEEIERTRKGEQKPEAESGGKTSEPNKEEAPEPDEDQGVGGSE